MQMFGLILAITGVNPWLGNSRKHLVQPSIIMTNIITTTTAAAEISLFAGHNHVAVPNHASDAPEVVVVEWVGVGGCVRGQGIPPHQLL